MRRACPVRLAPAVRPRTDSTRQVDVLWLVGVPVTPKDARALAGNVSQPRTSVVPRGFGGSDDPTNLRAAHRSCNGRKARHSASTASLYWG